MPRCRRRSQRGVGSGRGGAVRLRCARTVPARPGRRTRFGSALCTAAVPDYARSIRMRCNCLNSLCVNN